MHRKRIIPTSRSCTFSTKKQNASNQFDRIDWESCIDQDVLTPPIRLGSVQRNCEFGSAGGSYGSGSRRRTADLSKSKKRPDIYRPVDCCMQHPGRHKDRQPTFGQTVLDGIERNTLASAAQQLDSPGPLTRSPASQRITQQVGTHSSGNGLAAMDDGHDHR